MRALLSFTLQGNLCAHEKNAQNATYGLFTAARLFRETCHLHIRCINIRDVFQYVMHGTDALLVIIVWKD